MLNILTGGIVANEQDGEPVILRDEERFSGECLKDGELKMGACSQQKCMSSHTQSSAQALVRWIWIPPVLQKFWKGKLNQSGIVTLTKQKRDYGRHDSN